MILVSGTLPPDCICSAPILASDVMLCPAWLSVLSFKANFPTSPSCRADSVRDGKDPGDRGDRGKGEGGL